MRSSLTGSRRGSSSSKTTDRIIQSYEILDFVKESYRYEVSTGATDPASLVSQVSDESPAVVGPLTRHSNHNRLELIKGSYRSELFTGDSVFSTALGAFLAIEERYGVELFSTSSVSSDSLLTTLQHKLFLVKLLLS